MELRNNIQSGRGQTLKTLTIKVLLKAGGKRVLRLLTSSKNQSILGLLAIEPSYPRRLAEILDLSEADVARRLRRMKKAGLVTSDWTQVGQNVKLYRLTTDRFHLKIAPDGIQVSLDGKSEHKAPAAQTEAAPEALPSANTFVGREQELADLAGPEPVVVVLGLPGIGKTSLLAHHAGRAKDRGNVFWCGCRGVESFNWLAHRLALFFAKRHDTDLLRAIEQDAEPADKWKLMLAGMDKPGNLFIFDDAHRLTDESIQSFLEDAAGTVEKGKIILAAREPVRVRPENDRVRSIQLDGLTDDDIKAFLKAKGIPVDNGVLGTLREEVGGHPLALNLLVGAAQAKEKPLDEILARMPKEDLENFLLREVNDTLEEDERGVISLASLFRTVFTMEDLQTLTKRPVNGPLLRLRRKLLIETRGEGYFLHETLRNFFHDHLSDRERLHHKVAQRYLESDTEEGRLEAMHHLLAANRRDLVLEMLETNLDLREFERIETSYHDLYFSVLSMFRREEVADDRRWALIEDERGDILYHRGELEEALAHYDEASAIFGRLGESEHAADLSWKRALTLTRLGRQEEAEASCLEGLQSAPKEGLARRRLERLRAE